MHQQSNPQSYNEYLKMSEKNRTFAYYFFNGQ